ncbi:MAG: M6 family metalloprotease domain-containing protein [Bacteroidales bacterium]|nr:M6 family metalloprotease domain-containing protein [Bacteroidales bacterium]
MKKYFLFVFTTLFFVTQHVFAVPANPTPDNYTLPDGSVITLLQRGDEFVNWVTTLDGFTLLLNKDGFFEYAIQDQAGDLTLSDVRAHNESKRMVEERSFVANLPQGLSYSSFQIETMLELRGVREDFLRQKIDDDAQRMSGVVCTGNVRVPIILVGFQDRAFTTPKAHYEMLFNQLNLTSTPYGTVPGSLRDYFSSVSNGTLDVQVDVFGPYTMPNNLLHYSISGDCPGAGGQHRTLARLALDSAFHRGGADLASYNVTSVHIIFAGYGRENGASTCPSIWSHMSSIASPNTYNGKTFTNYSVSPEFRGTSGSNITYIGVVAHEMGHSLLLLPDFYSVGASCVDLGSWCLMASGSWNDNGRTPPKISAYGRVASGWVPEVTLSTPANITLPNPVTTDAVYRINTTTNNEYFLLENRQQTGWDAFIPSSGMLIYHTDRANTAALNDWTNNRVLSTCSRRRYYIKQAGCATTNGCNTGTGWTNRVNDPWPRSTFTEFTDNSTPNARSWAGANTAKPVTEITTNTTARTVSFKFMGGDITTPDAELSEFVDLLAVIPSTEANNLDIKVRLRNGGVTFTSASIAWSVNGVAQTPYLWSGSLANGAETVVTLGTINLTSGSHTISATVAVAGDLNPTNNTVSKIVKVVIPFFTENWEGSTTGWTFQNGTQTNKWQVGTAASNGGSRSAYISNDNGTSNTYSITSTSTVHLYRDITFPASTDSFDLYFDVRCMGEPHSSGGTPWDYMEVRIVATSVTPAAGTLLTQGTSFGRYFEIGSWQNISQALPPSYSNTTQRLVFSWRNDNTVGTQPPAAIDNIILASRTISSIYSISLSQTGTHTFTGANFGYSAPAPLSVTIANTGNQATGTLNIALSGTNPNDFTLSKTSITNIAAPGTDNFTVVPKTALAVGTYTATVTVSGSNSISGTFNVSFTVNKANGAAVSMPTVASRTHDSITVNTVSTPSNGQTVEYAIHTTNTAAASSLTWQDGTSFGSLSASTNYYVYARSKENISHNAGNTSVSAVITTLSMPTFGITLSQNGTHTFTAETFGYNVPTPLSVTITNTGNQPTGVLNIVLSGTSASSFTLSKTSISTIAVSDSDNFTVVPNTGLAVGVYTETVTVSGENGISGTFNVSFTVDKANGATVEAPIVASQTHNSIMVNTVAAPGNGQTVEYAIHTTNTATAKSTLTWQTGTTFDALSASTTYYVYARSAIHHHYHAGDHSVSAAITTLAVPTYGIVLSQSGTYTFTDANYGYVAQTPLSVMIINTENQPTGELTIALSGADANDFTLSKTVVPSISADNIDDFTVVPKTGLAVRTYTATVTVSGGNDISETFNVSFTVTDDGVAISDLEKGAILKVYPNPVFDGKLVVEIPNNVESEMIQIYDFSGKLVLTRVANHPKTEINISHLPDGTYILKIGAVSTKIVKR